MKAKKNRDLESEIINDLLSDDKTTPVNSIKESSGKLSELPNEETIKFNQSSIIPTNFDNEKDSGPKSLNLDQEVKVSVGGKIPIRMNTSGMNRTFGSDAALIQSENLRVAQQRIFELEQEIERLRTENEQLAAAGETIRKRADELLADNEYKAEKLTELKERLESEKEILELAIRAKDRELNELNSKMAEYEMRLSTNLQKIRVRERELENRLELAKLESVAVMRSKDETILELKRQIDQFTNELENYRNKGQELNRQIGEKHETLRRTVKALRLALNMLEGSSSEDQKFKKAK
ncbi:MAG: hypothetical protein ABL927_00595 [Bdellovibrionales bacterium]